MCQLFNFFSHHKEETAKPQLSEKSQPRHQTKCIEQSVNEQEKIHLEQAQPVQSHPRGLDQTRSFLGIITCKITWKKGKKGGNGGPVMVFLSEWSLGQ